MRFGSVCSGIEAASAAWCPLGWKAAFLSEIEAFPRAVLAQHYPATPLHGDFTTIQAGDYEPIDLLVGGTPCQSFSVAGLRGGMADQRGNLALEYLRLAERLRPTWLVWENVPGVLSSTGGRDFGSFLGGLVQLGYGFAYRVLDAQYFGLAQRRKRVFVVGCLGDWRRAAAVLFEPASLRWNPPPSRQAGQRSAPQSAQSVALRGRDGGGAAELGDDCGLTLRASQGGGDKPYALIAHSLRAEGFDAGEDGTGRGTPLVPVYAIQKRAVCENPDAGPDGAGRREGSAYTLEARSVPQAVAFAQNQRDEIRLMNVAGALASDAGMKQQTYAHQGSAVRRLTPRECERLQGFPDDYTLITVRNKPAADGPRYRALGNSMAVPVMAWIGRRIAQQHAAMSALQVAADAGGEG